MRGIVNMHVRELTPNDIDAVKETDDTSGFCLEQWLEDTGFGWGIFDNDTLIGYCSVGGADDVYDSIYNDPDYTYDALLLSDVYVKSEYRHKGVCTQMLHDVISKLNDQTSTIYCCPSYEALGALYEAAGFVSMDEECICMKLVRKSKIEPNTSPQTHIS